MDALQEANEMIYLTSDIHGCFKEFKKMLEYIHFQKDDVLYILGDVLGRGDEPIPLLKFIMEHPNMELLMGNHEQAFLWNTYKNTSRLSDEQVYELWTKHSGIETRDQYKKLPEDEQEEIIYYLRKRPMYKIIGKNILVHAGIDTEGIDYDSLETLMAAQKPDRLLWETKPFYCNPLKMKDPEVRVFFGHMFSLIIRQDRGEPLDSTEVWKDVNRLGMDCGYAFGGKMVMYCLDTDRVYYLTSSGVLYDKVVNW